LNQQAPCSERTTPREGRQSEGIPGNCTARYHDKRRLKSRRVSPH
jgi:hypothetical protein